MDCVLCVFFLISFSDSLLLVHKNATASCTFIFYPTTLLNSLIRSNRVVLIVFRISICHLQIETVLTSSFPIFMPMISLSRLMVLLGLLVLYWIGVWRVGTLVLFPILHGKFSIFHPWVWCSCGFAVYGLYCVEVRFFMTQFVEGFLSWMHVVLCQMHVKCFFCFYWDIHMIFIFHSINVMCHTVIDWHKLNHPWTPWTNPSWSWYIVL